MTYLDVLSQAQNLSLDEQYKLLQQLMMLLIEPTNVAKPRSVLELQGLGKEIWAEIDAQKYVEKERESWHG